MHKPSAAALRKCLRQAFPLALVSLTALMLLAATSSPSKPEAPPPAADKAGAPASPAPAPEARPDPSDASTFTTSPELALEARALVQLLGGYHYNRDAVKPDNYGEVITGYMKDLDSQRLFFLQSDADDFTARNPASGLYYSLTALGRVQPAYEIYGVYQKRVRSRVQWIFDHLDQPVDMEATDTYAFDRKDSPWPATDAEADALWEKRLRFEILLEVLSKKNDPKKTALKKTSPEKTDAEAAPPDAAGDTGTAGEQQEPEAKKPKPSAAPKSPEEILADARTTVRKRYERVLRNVDDVTANDLAEMFLARVAQLYDPHSTYFSADTYEDFSINMRLQLFGIGALLSVDPSSDVCVIKEIIPGGPADLSKLLRPNDKIIAVAQDNEEPVEVIGMKLRRIVEKIRGPKGTKVHLTIQPGASTDETERRVITLTRDVVNLDSARAHAAVFEIPAADAAVQGSGSPASSPPADNSRLQTLNPEPARSAATRRIGVITLPAFYGRDASGDGEQNSASRDIEELITRLKAAKIEGLILDMRANGGGLLSEAIKITGLFIRTGPVVQVRSYYGEVKIDRDEDSEIAWDGPLAVLVSRFSASASEIVAGALKNYGRAVIVGDKSTHGKGTVQQIIEMKNVLPQLAKTRSGATKLTVQKFYLPNGDSTQLKGVASDIVVPSINDYLPIGESDLPHALPWDDITTSFYGGQPYTAANIEPLLKASEQRQHDLEEFIYLRKRIERFRERQEEKTVSLNLKAREQRKADDAAFADEMDAERKRLESGAYTFTEVMLAPPPPPRIKAEDENTDDDAAGDLPDENERYAKLDIPLRETLRVVDDMITRGTPPLQPDTTPPPRTMTASTAAEPARKTPPAKPLAD
ncbi:carboxyl-terminal protease [Opitutaceae bacterium TAV5]|nr:carboxyl-terminal protease [Opitutaceae bacterium TAV5]